ncbi:hypothetical protein EQG49_11845 [Periweissella cryptocerci]|uniref:Uncharacterized protein n=1 Tax=Periweissella cryptocerci TaxID=2506420 RepID=A0A4P6YWD0_9LACO|nr:hypothetical protein [Periweissella cryptocerci]QBO37096.1 hypothetical protein EQG49_11845 [Periweissella cryptocerci]
MASEQFIKENISQFFDDLGGVKVFVTPNISEKQLVNASKVVGIDAGLILAIADTTLLNSGKGGYVFTGSKVLYKATMTDPVSMDYEAIESVEQVDKVTKDKKGRDVHSYSLEFTLKDGSTVKWEEGIMDTGGTNKGVADFLYILISELADGDEFEETNQLLELQDFGDEVILAYLKIIVNYLRSDDGLIDPTENSSLLGIISSVRLSKAAGEELREYRLNPANVLENDELLSVLKENIPTGSQDTVFQSLGNNLVLVKELKFKALMQNTMFVELEQKLGLTDDQIKFFIRSVEQDKKIITERLNDTQAEAATKELTALAGGAGVTLAALAVTGGVSGGVSTGLLTLAFASTGGMLIGVGAIAGAGYLAYKGMKYLTVGKEMEKNQVRQELLQASIKKLKISTTILLEDVNWVTTKLADALDDVDSLSDTNNLIMTKIKMLKQITASSKVVMDDQSDAQKELTIANLVNVLNIDKFNDLASKNVNSVKFKEFVMNAYNEETSDDGKNKFVLRQDLDEDYLEKVRAILETIGYFDMKESAVSDMKNSVKKMFGGS